MGRSGQNSGTQMVGDIEALKESARQILLSKGYNVDTHNNQEGPEGRGFKISAEKVEYASTGEKFQNLGWNMANKALGTGQPQERIRASSHRVVQLEGNLMWNPTTYDWKVTNYVVLRGSGSTFDKDTKGNKYNSEFKNPDTTDVMNDVKQAMAQKAAPRPVAQKPAVPPAAEALPGLPPELP